MKIKWMNVLVVFIFGLLLMGNKEYFFSVKAIEVAVSHKEEVSKELLKAAEVPERQSSDTMPVEKVSPDVVKVEEVKTSSTPEETKKEEAQKTVAPVEVKQEPAAAENVQEYYVIDIKPGMDSKSVSTLLLNLKIIDNSEEFNQFLMTYGYSRKIQIGKHQVKKGMSFVELSKELTTR